MSDEAVGCSVCGRAIYAKHADEEGRCSFCRPAAIERAKKAAERDEAAAAKVAQEWAEAAQRAAQTDATTP